jgi:hypothetical protein
LIRFRRHPNHGTPRMGTSVWAVPEPCLPAGNIGFSARHQEQSRARVGERGARLPVARLSVRLLRLASRSYAWPEPWPDRSSAGGEADQGELVKNLQPFTQTQPLQVRSDLGCFLIVERIPGKTNAI